MAKTLTEQVSQLAEQVGAISSAPILSRGGLALDAVTDVTDVLYEMARKLDSLTPYVDETNEGGEDETI